MAKKQKIIEELSMVLNDTGAYNKMIEVIEKNYEGKEVDTDNFYELEEGLYKNFSKILQDKPNKKETTEQGWDCEPQLALACSYIDGVHDEIYEIKNCKRKSNLKELVSVMYAALDRAAEILKEIDTETIWVTVEDEE